MTDKNPPHQPCSTALDLLNRRRSSPVRTLHPPAPDRETLERIITAATRVPDHGRLSPWRILEIPADHRASLAAALQQRHREVDPDIADAALDKDGQRFGDSPMLLVVIARITEDHKVPVLEQLLSGGCVCFALLQAAQAMGYAGQWLTGWAAYDPGVAQILGMTENERVLGFIHLGSAGQEAPERVRPALGDVFQQWQP